MTMKIKIRAVIAQVATVGICCLCHASGIMELNEDPDFVKETGGMLEFYTSGNPLCVADATKGNQQIGFILDAISEQCSIVIQKRDIDSLGESSYKTARKLMASLGCSVLVCLYDGGLDEPTLTAYPENKACFVNVSSLADGVSEKQYSSRLEKEIWRAVAFAAGGVNNTQMCVLKSVITPADLDATPCKVASPPVTDSIAQEAARMGIKRIVHMTYQEACEQGSAKAPTNAIQKAIWDKVHQLPKMPIKITPETRKIFK